MTLTGESSAFDFYYYSQKLNASLSDLEAELNGKLIIASGLPPLNMDAKDSVTIGHCQNKPVRITHPLYLFVFFSVTNRRNIKNTNIQVDDHLYASRHHNKAVYNIPNIQVCGLMGLFGLVLCLIVNNYHTQTPAIRMKYHPSDIYFCCLRTYYFSNFNL